MEFYNYNIDPLLFDYDYWAINKYSKRLLPPLKITGTIANAPLLLQGVLNYEPLSIPSIIPVLNVKVTSFNLYESLKVFRIPIFKSPVQQFLINCGCRFDVDNIIFTSDFLNPLMESFETVPSFFTNASFIPFSWYWTIDSVKVKNIYLFTLTGSADDKDDITIPISSCQMRRRDGDPSYMSVVVPGYDDYADAISARSNGEIIIYKGVRFLDGSQQVEEITRVNLEDIRLDKGAKERSITLTGHATTSNPGAKVVSLSGANYRNVGNDGLRRFRCSVDLWLRPGDTVEIEGESFTVGYISYTIGVGQEVMEIEEAKN